MIYVNGLSLMLDTHLRDIIPYVDTISSSSTNSFSLTVTLWYGVVERELDLELGDSSFSLGFSMFHNFSLNLSIFCLFVCLFWFGFKLGKVMTTSSLQRKWERHIYKCISLEMKT